MTLDSTQIDFGTAKRLVNKTGDELRTSRPLSVATLADLTTTDPGNAPSIVVEAENGGVFNVQPAAGYTVDNMRVYALAGDFVAVRADAGPMRAAWSLDYVPGQTDYSDASWLRDACARTPDGAEVHLPDRTLVIHGQANIDARNKVLVGLGKNRSQIVFPDEYTGTAVGQAAIIMSPLYPGSIIGRGFSIDTGKDKVLGQAVTQNCGIRVEGAGILFDVGAVRFNHNRILANRGGHIISQYCNWQNGYYNVYAEINAYDHKLLNCDISGAAMASIGIPWNDPSGLGGGGFSGEITDTHGGFSPYVFHQEAPPTGQEGYAGVFLSDLTTKAFRCENVGNGLAYTPMSNSSSFNIRMDAYGHSWSTIGGIDDTKVAALPRRYAMEFGKLDGLFKLTGSPSMLSGDLGTIYSSLMTAAVEYELDVHGADPKIVAGPSGGYYGQWRWIAPGRSVGNIQMSAGQNAIRVDLNMIAPADTLLPRLTQVGGSPVAFRVEAGQDGSTGQLYFVVILPDSRSESTVFKWRF